MDARFRALFLQQVQIALDEEPGYGALLKLLQLAKPEITHDDLADKKRRERAYRTFKLLIHPDKHPANTSVTSIFQNAQTFYEECCKDLRGPKKSRFRKKREPVSFTSAIKTLVSFRVEKKWPFASSGEGLVAFPHDPEKRLLAVRGLQCINYRGSIAHGKKTELSYAMHDLHLILTDNPVDELFSNFGGTRVLETVEAIKQEISENGPVVSVSYTPFSHSGQTSGVTLSPVLIVGWEVSSIGETWLIKTAASCAFGFESLPSEDRIAVGHFEIDTMCLAPKKKLDWISWQNDKVSLDVSGLGATSWYEWLRMDVFLSSERLQNFGKSLGDDGIVGAGLKKTPFLVREENAKARSRWAYLIGVTWDHAKDAWKVSVGLGN